MKDKKNIKAVVFDLDGTLIDSSKAILESLFEAVYKNGVTPSLSVEESYFFMGKSLGETLNLLIPEATSEIKAKVGQYYIDHYYDKQMNNAIIYPGVKDVLVKLKDDGIRLAVATAKHTFCAVAELSSNGVNTFFEHIRGSDDGVPPKPNPEILFQICDAFDLSPSEVLMVGDTDRDVIFARNAGCMSCSVTYGNWSKQMFIENNIEPDFYIDNITELLSYT